MASVTPENMLEVKEFFRTTIKDVKGQLNSKIVNNPKFEEVFFKEMAYFHRKTLNINFDVVVSEDKNSVSITSYSPVVDCSRPEFRGKNKAFLRSVFYLKDNNLVCEYNQGVLFDRRTLEKNGIRVELAYESKLETNYSTKYFDEFGIEYSFNSFSDVYPFDDESDDIDLREKTMSSFHKPVFSEYKLAEIPIHIMNASVRNTYRKKGSLAVIHSNVGTATRDGYKDITCALFVCHTTIPEMLRGGVMFAKTSEKSNNNNFRFGIVNDYSDTIENAYIKAREEFKKGIEQSSLKEYSKKTYDALLENI